MATPHLCASGRRVRSWACVPGQPVPTTESPAAPRHSPDPGRRPRDRQQGARRQLCKHGAMQAGGPPGAGQCRVPHLALAPSVTAQQLPSARSPQLDASHTWAPLPPPPGGHPDVQPGQRLPPRGGGCGVKPPKHARGGAAAREHGSGQGGGPRRCQAPLPARVPQPVGGRSLCGGEATPVAPVLGSAMHRAGHSPCVGSQAACVSLRAAPTTRT